jgi:Lrp/AsnC family transcriptional regulator for asnA, asnC and gidA
MPNKMTQPVPIDDIDKKILGILIQDARTSLKDMAKECDISAVSVMNRIKRLKKTGVITGATLFPVLLPLGFTIVATIGMETDSEVEEILKYLKDYLYLIEPSTGMGEYDLTAVVYAENMTTLNERVETIRRRFGVRKVIVNVWSGIPYPSYGNIDFTPLKEES